MLATLKLEFARTTAIALGIVDTIRFPTVRIFSPLVRSLLGDELGHWTKTVITSLLTIVAVAAAWYLQMIISAFYSGLRGGRMFADAAIRLLVGKGWIDKVPGIAKPFDPEQSYFDEAIGYTLAAFGFLFQLLSGFGLPFPFNLVFLPLTAVEWFLRLQISFSASGVHN